MARWRKSSDWLGPGDVVRLVVSISALVIGFFGTLVLAIACKVGDWITKSQKLAGDCRGFLAGTTSRTGTGNEDWS